MTGRTFADSARRLAGMAAAMLGWSPDAFWRATPAELASVVAALAGDAPSPPDRAEIAALIKAFPDG
ncbi:MAG: phage tail assembly chaperone [Sphingomonas sp.]|uniref:phage tail assembly chaperone n=1 Tax=Sphingomonas sp. TaxID=28214 RepID=UPI00184D90F2|nr:phage tail assembly chaperone [Sphingomonas sp.]